MSIFPSTVGDLDDFDNLLNASGVQLEILRGQAKHRLRPIVVPVFLIGSGNECDLVLADPQIPTVHTYLCSSEDSLSIRHLGHDPPLHVNGELAATCEVRDGDTVRLGRYEFAVRTTGNGPCRASRTIQRHDQARRSMLKLYTEPTDDIPAH